MTLGQKIKKIRKNMGLSQEVLGEILCVSRQTITKWETDTGIPDINNLQEISKLFGLPIDYFLNDKEIINETMMEFDIKEYKNNKLSNIDIIRKYYSDEWDVKFLYSQRKFIFLERFIDLLVLNIFENAVDYYAAVDLTNEIKNNQTTFYLLSRDNMYLLVSINNEKMTITLLGDIKIKRNKFVYKDKVYKICNEIPEKLNNKKIFYGRYIRPMIIALVIALLLIIGVLTYLFLTFG